MIGIKRFSLITFKCAVFVGMILAFSGFTAMTRNPAQAEIVTSDVSHFWKAFDDAAKVPPGQRAAIYAKEYFDVGSPGLKDIIPHRLVSPEAFTDYVEKHRDFYRKVRPYIQQVVGQKPVIAAAFRRFKRLYPDIKFPKHIYFVVGRHSFAGTSSDNGIILAAEMFATPPGTPYSYNKTYPIMVPFAVVHETVHFNQTFQPGNKVTLLQNVIIEGTADFIASLTLPEPGIRQYADRWQYGCPHEAALAARFAAHEDMTTTGPWMYNHHPVTGWPPDMGYWLGYRIDQTFYDHAADKTDAIRTLLQVTDFKTFLKESGYPDNTPACAPEKPATSNQYTKRSTGKPVSDNPENRHAP